MSPAGCGQGRSPISEIERVACDGAARRCAASGGVDRYRRYTAGRGNHKCAGWPSLRKGVGSEKGQKTEVTNNPANGSHGTYTPGAESHEMRECSTFENRKPREPDPAAGEKLGIQQL